MTKPIDFFWFIPTSGDGTYLGSADLNRAPDYPYLREIAVAVDRLGYKGVLLPTGAACEESFVMAAALAPATKQLKYLVAIRPGVTVRLPAAAVATVQRPRLLGPVTSIRSPGAKIAKPLPLSAMVAGLVKEMPVPVRLGVVRPFACWGCRSLVDAAP